MATAAYALFEVVGWAPTEQSYPFMAVLFDTGEDDLALVALCLN